MNYKKLTCIDDTISEGDARKQINDYVNKNMIENDNNSFEMHLKECNYCRFMTFNRFELVRELALDKAYYNLTNAHREKKWSEVIVHVNMIQYLGRGSNKFPGADITNILEPEGQKFSPIGGGGLSHDEYDPSAVCESTGCHAPPDHHSPCRQLGRIRC